MFNTKYAYWFSNAVGIVKICTIVFIILTGFVVLGGNTKVEDPMANFRDAWSGSKTASAYGMTIALYRIIFSYGGYNNAFNVANEVKVRNTVTLYATSLTLTSGRTLSDRSRSTLRLLLLLYTFCTCLPTSPSSLPVSSSQLSVWPSHQSNHLFHCSSQGGACELRSYRCQPVLHQSLWQQWRRPWPQLPHCSGFFR